MTDQSNMQNLHIPAEWVEAARQAGMPSSRAYDPIYVEFDLEAALSAVIPLIRADERDVCALLIEDMRVVRTDDYEAGYSDGLSAAADRLREQGER